MPLDDEKSSTPIVPISQEAIAMAKIAPIKPTEMVVTQPDIIKNDTVEMLGAVPMATTRKARTDSKVRHWVPKHINKRVCNWFIPQPTESSDPVCFCNYEKSRHIAEARENHAKNPDEKKWKDSKHTKTFPTDAYGDIEFIGYGQRMSKYVRADPDTPMDRVLELMLDHWHLDPPNLLISVTGGARNFRMQPRLSEVFRRGLMNAASSTGAWITTGGMHAGVMKLVGQAVADWTVANGSKAKVTAIGIACWGCVNNKDSLIDTPAGTAAQYRVEKPRKPKHSSIDMNHSHFILVDNGTQMKFATEIAFRAQLEKAISSMGTATDGDNIAVPVVCVVVEGGPGTLETVMRALQTGTPAVIVEGSGRAADLLAYAYTNSHEIEIDATDQYGKKRKKMVPIFDEDLWTEVRKMIFDEWGDRDLDSRVNWVKECFQYRHNMTIFRLDGGTDTKDIDVAILQALLKANKEHVTDQLKLALAWNRIDVAKSEIFTEDKRWEKGELDDAMYMALINDRPDFVQLFLENGLSLKDFLTLRVMIKLYNEIPENSLLHSLLAKKVKDEEYFSLEMVGHVIQSLIGDFYQPLYNRDTRYRGLQVSNILNGRTSRAVSTINVKDGDLNTLLSALDYDQDTQVVKGLTKYLCVDEKTGEQYVLHDFDHPSRELFLWSVLLNRFDMARVFWEEGKVSIAAALVAQKLMKSMAAQNDDTEVNKAFQENIMKFSDLAVGVLSECHTGDETQAGLLLVRKMDYFGKTTILQLAVSADNKLFISHAACQSLLNTIWRGRMAPEVSMWRIWVSLFCPPLLYLLLTYRPDDREELVQRNIQERKSKLKSMKAAEADMFGAGDHRGSLLTTDSRALLIDDHKQSSSGPNISCIDKLIYFYNAPLVTFIHNCLSYLIFLLLYSYILLTDFTPTISILEIVLIVWVFTLFTEEIRQVVMDESFSLYLKLQNYFSDIWNYVDVLTLLTFLIGLILRCIPGCTACFDAARIILSLNLMTFFFRLLHIFSVHKELGPKLVMIGRMMIDLLFFMAILVVFFFAYGIALQAILYPNTPLSFDLVRDVLKKPYWQMYGELFLEELEGEIQCTTNMTEVALSNTPRCPENTWIGPVLLAFYILVTNVLMLNLLIAMFSYTFTAVQDESDLVWNFERYMLIKEYYVRPPLIPPLIIISHIYIVIKALGRLCCKTNPSHNDFKIILNEEETHQLVLWEDLNQEEYNRNSQAQQLAMLDNQVAQTHDRVSSIMTKVDEIVESNFLLSSNSTASSAVQPKLPPALDERMNCLEEQMKRTSKALDWIIQSMVEKGAGAKGGPPQLIDLEKMKKDAHEKKLALENKEKEQYKEMLKRQLELHVKSRTKQYPCCYEIVYRFPVPDDKVAWEEAWPQYDPTMHTDKTVLDLPNWADQDLMELDPTQREFLLYNEMDGKCKVDRRSFMGTYNVKKGLPINPKGRTGLTGRGLLGRWGPNHAGDPIVTRWAKNVRGEQIKNDGKPVLEFVAIQRQDNKHWAIPGGLLQLGQTVNMALKADFTEEALGNLPDPSLKEEIKAKVNELFKGGHEVYKGYSDDPRNTDNAWVETTAVNYHDEEGILTHFTLRAFCPGLSSGPASWPKRAPWVHKPHPMGVQQAGGSAEMVRWMKISTQESLYAAHIAILQKVASRLKADF